MVEMDEYREDKVAGESDCSGEMRYSSSQVTAMEEVCAAGISEPPSNPMGPMASASTSMMRADTVATDLMMTS